MQAILEQLLSVVLALVTLISSYMVGAAATPAPAAGMAQPSVSAVTQVAPPESVAATAEPATPLAPASIVASQETASQPAAPQEASVPQSSAATPAATVGAVAQVVVQQPAQLSVQSVAIITDDAAYGARAFVQEAEVADALYVAPDGSDSNPGTKAQPFGTIQHALDVVKAGQTVYVRGGTYKLAQRLITKNSGTPNAWITIAGYPGETPVLDASEMDLAVGGDQYSHDLGAFLVTNDVAYVRVQNFTVKSSPGAGFSVCRGSNIVIEGNTVNGSYTPGISTNSTFNHDCAQENIVIRYNTLINTNNIAFSRGMQTDGEAPHESISIMGAKNVEIAYNHIHDTAKEGIDVKERSSFVTVHHNLVENIARQCFYVDAWYGELHDVEFYGNIGRRCGFFGFAISVEDNVGGGSATASNISFHHNLIDGAGGAAVYFSRFASDGPRRNVKIFKNTFYNSGHSLSWAPGGLTMLSANVHDTQIVDNIFVNNAPFQMGANTEYGGMAGLVQRNIVLKNNLINGQQGAADMMDGRVEAIEGEGTIVADPLFANPGGGDFTLRHGSPAIGAATDGGNIGAF